MQKYCFVSHSRWIQRQQQLLNCSSLRGRSSSNSSSSTPKQRLQVRAAQEPASTSSSTAPLPSVLVTKRGPFTWASCVSTKPNVQHAVDTAVSEIMKQHQRQQQQEQQQQQQQQQGTTGQPQTEQLGFTPDLAIVYASCNYGPQLQDVVKAVRRAVPSVKHIFGCSAYGVVGSSPQGACEVEGVPGVSISLAQLPGVELSLVHTLRSGLPSEDAPPESWADLVGVSPVAPLTQSPTPSNDASQDDEEGEDTAADRDGAAAQQQQEQQPAEPSSSNGSGRSSSSSSSSGNEKDLRELMRRSSSAVSPSAAAGGGVVSSASSAVSFMFVCDPKFPQVRQMLAGLDFAFPDANKVGVVLSQGQQNKRRVMFAWSAEGGVEAGGAAWRRRTAARRQKQQAEAAAAVAATGGITEQHQQAQPQEQQQLVQVQQQQQQVQEQSQPSPQQQNSSSSKQGLFKSLFGSLLAGLNDNQQQPTSTQQPQQPLQGSSSSSGAAMGVSAEGEQQQQQQQQQEEQDEGDDGVDSSGVFMYGAAVLALKGPLVLEPLTCQGYRTLSDKVWVVGDTSREGDLILNLVDPDAAEGGEEEEGQDSVSPFMGLMQLVDEVDDDSLLGESSQLLAVAIAPDSWSPVSALTPEQYTVAAISEVWTDQGFVRIDSQARPGYRMRFVLRDEKGMRDDLDNRLTALKRSELAGVMAGRKLPQPLAAMMFSDVSRGSICYKQPNYESTVVSSFLPVPIGGAFGAAQVSTVNGVGALYEQSTVIGVLRMLPQPSDAAGTSSADVAEDGSAQVSSA